MSLRWRWRWVKRHRFILIFIGCAKLTPSAVAFEEAIENTIYCFSWIIPDNIFLTMLFFAGFRQILNAKHRSKCNINCSNLNAEDFTNLFNYKLKIKRFEILQIHGYMPHLITKKKDKLQHLLHFNSERNCDFQLLPKFMLAQNIAALCRPKQCVPFSKHSNSYRETLFQNLVVCI